MSIVYLKIKDVQIILIIILFQLYTNVFGQELPNQVQPSPSTMLFQRYGDYPVSLYTGIPEIKIPIYTIKEGDITVPIYLSFHASGFNVDEAMQPGLIGPGWTIHTGGMISRTINGIPDEDSGVRVPDFRTNTANRYGEMHSFYINDNTFDHELDIYSYNFLGYSGKYIPNAHSVLDNPYNPTPYDSFKLTEDGLKVFFNEIKDENGLFYFFGGQGAEELTDYQVGNQNYTRSAISTWHLSGIVSTRFPGSSVGFKYQAGAFYNNQNFVKYVFDDAFDENGGGGISPSFYPYSFQNGNNKLIFPSGRQYQTVAPYLINFSLGYVKFNLNNEKKLISIEVFNKQNVLQRSVELIADNFPNASFHRRLKALVFKDAMGKEQERYSFNYFAEYASLGALSKDYWGFFNNQPFYGDHVPSYYPFRYHTTGWFNYTTNITFGGQANREADGDAAKTFMLEKITYPTGGYTLFDFEGNRTQFKQLGGLRVKKIANYNSDGSLANSKSYTYEGGSTELDIDKYLLKEDKGVMYSYNPGRRRYLSENATVPLSPKGASTGYPFVTETDGETTTYYAFDNDNAYQYDKLDSPIYFVRDESEPLHRIFANHYRPWNFGSLISKHTVGTGFSRTEEYQYETLIKNTVHDVVMNQQIENIPSPEVSDSFLHYNTGSIYNFANRYYYSGVKRLIKTDIYEKGSDGREVHKEETLTYSNPEYPNRVTSKVSFDSRGDRIKTDLNYSYDQSGAIYQKMTEDNWVAEPIEQVRTNLSKGNKELSRIKVEYDFFNPISLNPGSIQLKNIKKSVGGNSLMIENTAEKYDTTGNILQQRDKDGIVISFIYGYNNKFLVAKLIGADYNTAVSLINHNYINGLSISDENMRSHLSSLRNFLPNAHITTYTYKPLVGMTSQTDPKGMTTYFEYDSFQRLKHIKDQNGNIVKSYCYNYAGQVSDCNVGGNTGNSANWVNTGMNSECETQPDPFFNNQPAVTGNMLIEQVDNNPNSPTYNTTRKIIDPTAQPGSCPPSYYYTTETDPYLSSVTFNAKRSYDDGTTKTMRFRVRHDSIYYPYGITEEYVDIQISSSGGGTGYNFIMVNAASYLEVELMEVF